MLELRLMLALLVVSGLIGVLTDLKVLATESYSNSLRVSARNGSINQAKIETLEGCQASDLPYKYVGNNFSAKFHRPSCPFAKAMNGHNAVLFHFRKEAIAAGHHPCRYCLPPVWKSVRCAIIHPNDLRKEEAETDVNDK